MTSPWTNRRTLAANALAMAIHLRQHAQLGLDGPIDVFALCDRLRVQYRFIDVSMEGMYERTPRPCIVLSALRPLARRVFNCAHELGHHVFGHGLTIDALVQEHVASAAQRGRSDLGDPPKLPNEFLVDAFAGFLLMPSIALRKAYTARGLRIETATPAQHFTVACAFGVGYVTLISHLTFGAKRLSPQRAEALVRVPLTRIRSETVGTLSLVRRLIVADEHWRLPAIDIEVGTHLLLPRGARPRGDHLTHVADGPLGSVFLANRPGITRVHALDGHWAAFVRVSRFQYVGLGRYRHLDAPLDDEDDAADQDTESPVTLAGQPVEGDHND